MNGWMDRDDEKEEEEEAKGVKMLWMSEICDEI